ncbi:alpha/beta hydrolase [Cupriavidus sp. BIS7]|uniref:serine aminopeptidase domain-containing protein n=1 Tax=Cupriavidus sp. BIS7 TaxID=1217718 RepID=UPI00031762BE|nr:alpha/beta hydrolase [Cupriavidus sp. BIS7]
MRRIAFEGCTGWLHGEAGQTGVVLCAPPGHEGMWSHRALRHLADDLAAAGMPALRFDYHGTGDAAGTGDEPERLACWVGNIIAATEQLRMRTGVRQVVLCGMRLGASLAALAAGALAQRGEAAAALVLLAPVVSGRAFLREMRALHLNWINSVAPDLARYAAPEGGLDVLSYRLSADLVHAVQAFRLDRQQDCPSSRVLILDPWLGPASAVPPLVAHYQAMGAHVETGAFPEYPGLMQSTEYSAVPEQAWQQVTAWLASLPPCAQASVAPAHDPGECTEFATDGALEQSVWLEGASQFGVLSLPGKGSPAKVAVIFPNTGGNHHVGDGRLFVTLARRLARNGVASLRLDLAALGDSPQAWRRMSIPDIYAPAPRAQLAKAVDWMHARGFEHIVLAGVCSGAFLSLHAALANDRVCGLVLANLVKYTWGEADVASLGEADQPLVLLWHAARKPGNWMRLLRGDIHLGRLLKGVARRVRTLAAYGLGRWRPAPRGVATVDGAEVDAAHSARAFAWAAMRRLDTRGVRTQFLYGATDIGLEETAQCLGRNLEALQGLSHISLQRLDCLDHALFLHESRERFSEHVMRHVEAQLARVATQANPVVASAAASAATSAAVARDISEALR